MAKLAAKAVWAADAFTISSQLMSGLNETGCYIKLGLKGLPGTNALAYCAYLLVMKKMKGL